MIVMVMTVVMMNPDNYSDNHDDDDDGDKQGSKLRLTGRQCDQNLSTGD